jgi:hypothetical protein
MIILMPDEIVVGVDKLHDPGLASSQIDVGKWSGSFQIDSSTLAACTSIQNKDSIVMEQDISTTQLSMSSSNIDQTESSHQNL